MLLVKTRSYWKRVGPISIMVVSLWEKKSQTEKVM